MGSAALPVAVGAAWWLGVPALLAAALILAIVLALAGRAARSGRCTAAHLGGAGSVAARRAPALDCTARDRGTRGALARRAAAGRAFAALGFAEPSLMFLAGTDTRWFARPEAAARFLAAGPDRVVLVDRSEQPAFAAAAASLGLRPQRFATVRGFNYSNGHRVTLLLEENSNHVRNGVT